MGPVNWLAVLLGAAAFFAVGAMWYGVLFRGAWERHAGIAEKPRGFAAARTLFLVFACEWVISAMFGHLLARTNPPDHVKMMMAAGLAAAIMMPAIGINYLQQRRPLMLFLIDAGHLVAGMVALGSVFVLLG